MNELHSPRRWALLTVARGYSRRANLRPRSILVALSALALVLCILLLGDREASAGVPAGLRLAPGKIEQRVLADTESGKSTQFIVLFAPAPDLSAAYGMKDQDARGWFVYSTLKANADKTQTGVQAVLAGMGLHYSSYWVANALVVSGDRALVDSLASRPEVSRIESDDPFRGFDDTVDQANTASPDTTEWGVQRVNAPQVWAMGFTGQGIVIANQDTGMRWTHNAIKPHYRGWNGTTADHNYNWWDAVQTPVPGHTTNPCGYAITAPCDDNGHGTHTTGTTSGDDGAGNQVGVAPGAKWIGCRNMDAGDGRPSTYMGCFQFFVAPTDLTGNNPNPTLRPHVMNNSWGCPASETCAANTLQASVESAQAAGIFVEASAGNSGSGCSTVTDPPALYAASFSTGAIDINNALASFSSRGPVTADGSNRMKPNISAPGVSVRSSYDSSDTSYATLSGTSMAGPHVVGVVALLWSAHPELSRMITETKNLLQNTANPGVTVSPVQTCGGIPSSQIPNNSFGYGRVDALAAVNAAALTPTPTATGTPPSSTPTSTTTITSTPTSTYTPTSTSTPTSTRTNTPTATYTFTPTSTPTPTYTPTPTSTLTPTYTPTSATSPVMRGHVTLQSRPSPPDPRLSVPVTLTLRLNSDPAADYGLTTDQSGYFTITVTTGPGAYSWRVKNSHTLANSGAITLTNGFTDVDMGTLLEGDADNNNCVNAVDMSILRAAFGSSSGDPNFNPNTDFNGDNVVNATDFSLFRNNFGFCGAP